MEDSMGTEGECNRISRLICDAAIEVHRELGPGLLESVYEEALAREFDRRKIFYERQKTLPILYKGESLAGSFRIDFMNATRMHQGIQRVVHGRS
jgi:GxxExxY protein